MKARPVSLLALSFSLLGVLFTSPAIASEIVYGTCGSGQSYNEASGWPVGTLSIFSDDTQKMEAALSFTATQSYTFDSIDVAALLSFFNTSNQFTVSLARDSGSNLPGATLEVFSFTGITDSPTVYSASSILHPQLTANEKYWVVMSSDDLLSIYLEWLDTDQSLDGEIAYKNGLFTDWVSGYADCGSVPALEVRGTAAAVPEPASMLLLALGLAGLAGTRGRYGRDGDSGHPELRI
jgi:hypothetical protein